MESYGELFLETKHSLFFLDGALTFYSGICLLYKQRGQTPPRPTRKRYCVGKCHHRRLFNLAQQKIQVTLFLVRDLALFNGKYKKVIQTNETI